MDRSKGDGVVTNQNAVASCPFCKGAISSDLVKFGGNCAHCLLEIPGEDAPTDPGLIARKRQEAEAMLRAKAQRRRNTMLGAFVGVLALGAAGFMFSLAESEKAARTYEMPDDLYLPPLQEAAVPDPIAVVQPTPADKVKPTGKPAPQTVTNTPTAPVQPVALAGSSGPKKASGSATGDAEVAMTATGSMTTSIEPAALSVSTSKGPLSDESEVFAMIKQVMTRYNPQVQACYNTRLKAVPELAGGWTLGFTVVKDGGVKAVSVKPVKAKDAELESCLLKTVSAWKFAPITYEQPVTKTVRFGASGW